ncbi:MAG: DsbA family protein [Bacteroidaceae bacterium]|nr:DsbA family protein [Bacteroidaceae bacterium]MBQ3622973.1 DsbA family protein [Bacteroidaceae bacterium]
MDRLKITIFADPVCTWCWGTSPITRALEYRYGDNIELVYVMSAMVEDIHTYNNRRLEIGGSDVELSNRNILKHWLEASRIHGMPVKEHGFHLFSETYRSTVPQCLAYITSKLLAPKNANGQRDMRMAHRFYRRIQEATAVEALQTSNAEVLIDLAAVEGYEPNLFRETMESTKAQNTFEADNIICRHYAVQSTPSFLLEYNRQELLLQGFTTRDTLEHNIEQFTYGKVKPIEKHSDGTDRLTADKRNVRAFIARHTSVYPVEIATAFALERHNGHTALNIESYDTLPGIIEELVKAGDITITPHANSFKIYSLREGSTNTQQREREYAGTF